VREAPVGLVRDELGERRFRVVDASARAHQDRQPQAGPRLAGVAPRRLGQRRLGLVEVAEVELHEALQEQGRALGGLGRDDPVHQVFGVGQAPELVIECGQRIGRGAIAPSGEPKRLLRRHHGLGELSLGRQRRGELPLLYDLGLGVCRLIAPGGIHGSNGGEEQPRDGSKACEHHAKPYHEAADDRANTA